ncbi:MAG: hypothetical protein QOF12_2229 [Solirubrobacteraceae bacterium]|jgi:hypothetical protein|nr:hypothetical protein [Solirubrobacteraceae bacterium]
MEDPDRHDGEAEELLQRALLDAEASAAVSLKVDGLAMAEAMTVIFHGRRDLGTIQTYVTHGGRGAGEAVSAAELLRVPCDLDLSEAQDRDEAEGLYAVQANALRDAIVAADTVLAVWAEPLGNLAGQVVSVDRSIALPLRLPVHRLMPVALTAPERGITVVPVCGARTLAEGRPPLGIACAQQDLVHVYPLPDDPERCLEDFSDRAAEHARALADQLSHQDASVQRFLELSDGFPETG